jgi:hypothetical protein
MVKKSPYSLESYDFESLVRIVGEGTHPQSFLSRFRENNYFKRYLERLQAKTVIIENNYIDKDYLEDFSAYYVRCFQGYVQTCRRLHFFSESFEESDFQLLLLGSDDQEIQKIKESYLGFMVVKPLPQTRIGRTCLKRSDLDGDRKHFPVTRNYTANLFGISLTVESLAFQEQDKVVSACATSALWSAFHWTGHLYQHHIPSPVLITKSAGQRLEMDTRPFPNRGLTGSQMCQAIRDVGLDPILLNYSPQSDEYLFRITLYAYLKGGMPIILGVNLEEIQQDVDQKSFKVVKVIGKHAVTITGYSVSVQGGKPFKKA